MKVSTVQYIHDNTNQCSHRHPHCSICLFKKQNTQHTIQPCWDYDRKKKKKAASSCPLHLWSLTDLFDRDNGLLKLLQTKIKCCQQTEWSTNVFSTHKLNFFLVKICIKNIPLPNWRCVWNWRKGGRVGWEGRQTVKPIFKKKKKKRKRKRKSCDSQHISF